ncbi:uncharacterized protein LOC103705775 [Phoenix dactylifera]|uniref:Uncharacterized protein LOC103705775 n=1 Tax=Phoenix dactylifera TaxID=42345 RepID=A0A8B7BY76_PHODC|nr:uncharacterized protein LOC103705775 [Phoenix dactylifera]
MASVSAAAMAMPLPRAGHRKPQFSSDAFFHPLRFPARVAASSKMRASIRASSVREKAVAGLTGAAVAAAMLIPDLAEAAQPGISPSLKNFLLSIVAGGVVLGVIVGAVIGVANFDPVKRS